MFRLFWFRFGFVLVLIWLCFGFVFAAWWSTPLLLVSRAVGDDLDGAGGYLRVLVVACGDPRAFEYAPG